MSGVLLRRVSVQLEEVAEMDERVFRISKSFRSSLIGATILGIVMIAAAGGMVASAWTQDLNQRQRAVIFWLRLLFSMLVVAAVLWCLYTLKQIKYKVVVGVAGIERIPESAPAVSVAWSDIVAVEARSRANRLRLYGSGNRFLMEMDWQLDGADKLEELIHQKVYRDRLVHEQIKHFSVWKGANKYWIFATYRIRVLYAPLRDAGCLHTQCIFCCDDRGSSCFMGKSHTRGDDHA
jgi:hypothetical protein